MDQNDYSDNEQRLEYLSNKCEEESLKFYCECLIHMNRAFYKIHQTKMLSYVRQIMSPAFPLVIERFIHRGEAYLVEKDKIKKAFIRQDMEESIKIFSEVFEEIVHSTNGADRILFQSAPIDIGVRYTAPKLCAYYSCCLNELSEILSKTDGGKYAFCVYPTQISVAEAELLFGTDEERGKVCIIRIPVYKTANVQHIRQVLVHEFFHIQPAGLRLRKERAANFLSIILYSIYKYVFQDCKLNEEEIKRLVEVFFKEPRDEALSGLVQLDESDRMFYSRNITEYYLNILNKYISNMSGANWKKYLDALFPDKQWRSYKEYCNDLKRIKKIRLKVQDNLSEIAEKSVLIKYLNTYMKLFRESFSDILTLIILERSPLDYFSGFQYEPKIEEDRFYRFDLYFRVLFVAETLSLDYYKVSDEKKEFLGKWKKWRECAKGTTAETFVHNVDILVNEYNNAKMEAPVSVWAGDSNTALSDLPENVFPVPMDTEMKEKYRKYFSECFRKFLDYEKENEEVFRKFRKKYCIEPVENDTQLNYKISMRSWEIHKTV